MLSPVNRDLRPDHDAHPVGGPRHALVVGIVRKADIVAAKLASPSEQGLYVFVVVGTAGTIGRLGVDRNASQEDRLTIEQNLCSVGFDRSESDLISELVFTGGDLDVVQLRLFGRPELHSKGRKSNGCTALVIKPRRSRSMHFGNRNCDSLAGN